MMIDKIYYPIGIYPWIFMVIYNIISISTTYLLTSENSNLFYILLIKADNDSEYMKQYSEHFLIENTKMILGVRQVLIKKLVYYYYYSFISQDKNTRPHWVFSCGGPGYVIHYINLEFII